MFPNLRCKDRKAIALLLFLAFQGAHAQSTYLPHDPDIYHWITRAEIKTGGLDGRFHSAIKPYTRKDAVALMDSNQKWNLHLSRVDQYHVRYFREVNSEWSSPDSSSLRKPVLGVFFKRKADLLSYHDDNFDLHANIAGCGFLGKTNDNTSSQYVNTRGVEVRGLIAKRVGFYTFMADNQMVLPGYVNQWNTLYRSVPHEGFWKRVGPNGYDFFTARGYITFAATRFIELQVGHDKVHVGNGYRSLILSDFGNNYSFAKINTRIWKIQYTNLYANIKNDISAGPSGVPGSRLIADKYLFLHRLGINIGKRVNFGLFESVIAGRDPAIYPNATKLDLGYLNPIIFYRSAEQNSGSPDNANLGADIKIILFKKVQVYGQMLLDEFLMKEIKAQNGWWGNKYAFQVGLNYVDVGGLKNVDLQLEYNFVRPYTYSHLSSYTSYAHYSQPLAHPLGANFKEFLAILRVQPFSFLNATIKTIYYTKGVDFDANSYGGNVLVSYTKRVKTYGNEVGQGATQNVLFIDATLSYQPWTNVFVDVKQVVRTIGGQKLPGEQNTNFTSVGLRVNLAQRLHEF